MSDDINKLDDLAMKIRNQLSLLEALGAIADEKRKCLPDTGVEILPHVIKSMQQIDEIKDLYSEMYIPEDVIKLIDDRMNPNAYSRKCFERAIRKNKEGKGKFEAISAFSNGFYNEMWELFNEEMNEMSEWKSRSSKCYEPSRE